jgi:hypothetical protein
MIEPALASAIDKEGFPAVVGALATCLGTNLNNMHKEGQAADANGVLLGLEHMLESGTGSVVPPGV